MDAVIQYASMRYKMMMTTDAAFLSQQLRSVRQLDLDWRVLTVEELADRADFVTKCIVDAYRGDMESIRSLIEQNPPLSEWHDAEFNATSLANYAAILVTCGDDQTEFIAFLKECRMGEIKVMTFTG